VCKCNSLPQVLGTVWQVQSRSQMTTKCIKVAAPALVVAPAYRHHLPEESDVRIFNYSQLPAGLRPAHPRLGPWNSRECWCHCCNSQCVCDSCTEGEPYISIFAHQLADDSANRGKKFYACRHCETHVFTCAHKRNVHQVHCLWTEHGMDVARWNMEQCSRCDTLTMIVNLKFAKKAAVGNAVPMPAAVAPLHHWHLLPTRTMTHPLGNDNLGGGACVSQHLLNPALHRLQGQSPRGKTQSRHQAGRGVQNGVAMPQSGWSGNCTR
jgi:hypothetical protein